MRLLASLLIAGAALMVIACGGGADAGNDSGEATETARNSVTSTTPVPAPPWATGANTGTSTPATTGMVETVTPLAMATAHSTTVPTAPAAATARPPAEPTLPPPATPTPTPAFPASVIVGIQDDLRFAPNRTTIAAGGNVTFAWNGEVFHNVVSDKGGFATDLVKSGSFTFTLGAPGSYSYMCEVHPTTMKGIIEVK